MEEEVREETSNGFAEEIADRPEVVGPDVPFNVSSQHQNTTFRIPQH